MIRTKHDFLIIEVLIDDALSIIQRSHRLQNEAWKAVSSIRIMWIASNSLKLDNLLQLFFGIHFLHDSLWMWYGMWRSNMDQFSAQYRTAQVRRESGEEVNQMLSPMSVLPKS